MATEKQRRETARRQLERQLEERAEREAARKRFTMIASIVGTLVLIVAAIITVVIIAGGDDSTAGAVSCDFAAAGTASKTVKPPAATASSSGTVAVSVTTNRGDMSLTLDRASAPCTVASFLSLVKQKYYDSSPCHRLTTAGIYVLQCGDPSGTGTGGPGYGVPDEATGKEQYPAGTVAMARGQAANSGGSQFFIVYRDSPSLVQGLGKLQYTVFGKVSTGLPVVTKIAAAGSDNGNGQGDGKPKLATTITSMQVAN